MPPSPEQMPVPASSPPRANDHLGRDRHRVELRFPGQLRGHELDVVPLRQLLPRDAHRRHWTVVPKILEPFIGQTSNQTDMRLGRVAVRVLKRPLRRGAVVRLGMRLLPGLDFVLVDTEVITLQLG